ncbi:MAG TPA: hypothetical protein VHK91_12310 [Flavisolibacter sp.]|jgi:hypothetical protein|nr:hypothetical protein [Flavisolibacter sp.]
MKQTKRLFGLLVMTAITAYACVKSRQESNPSPSSVFASAPTKVKSQNELLSASPFTKEVGSPVPHDSAMQWIQNFTRTALAATSSMANQCMVRAQDLAPILKQKNCVGILFYHGYDPQKGWVLMPLGINTSGAIIKSSSVASSIGVISWDKAKALKAAYKNVATSLVEGEFFGANTFERLMGIGKATRIQVRKGINDTGECLILNNADVTNSLYYEDRSMPCPTICPTDGL